jgi:formylglycine-generating enzyme
MVRERLHEASPDAARRALRGWVIAARVIAGVAGLAACGRVDLGSQQLDSPPDTSALPPVTPITPVTPGDDVELGHPTQSIPSTATVPPSMAATPGAPLGGLQDQNAPGDGSATAPSEPGGDAHDAGADAAIPRDPPPDPAAPSCRGATEFCGRNSDSCCLSLPVAGGPLALPIDAAGTRVQVELSSFHLDKYEVTVGRFREFLADYDAWRAHGNPAPGAGQHPRAPDSGWREADSASLPANAQEFERLVRECNTIPLSTLDLPNSSSRIPLNCITWPEAAAFCAWDDARLPTYAEWYHAAAGGALDRVYPWGNEPTPSRLYALYGCALGLERPECTAAYVLPVGSHPNGAGFFAHEDLAGSMTEWLLDGALEPFVDGCVDCVGVPPTPHRFWKSGSWVDSPSLLQNTYFAIVEQMLRLPFLGLRCARDER